MAEHLVRGIWVSAEGLCRARTPCSMLRRSVIHFGSSQFPQEQNHVVGVLWMSGVQGFEHFRAGSWKMMTVTLLIAGQVHMARYVDYVCRGPRIWWTRGLWDFAEWMTMMAWPWWLGYRSKCVLVCSNKRHRLQHGRVRGRPVDYLRSEPAGRLLTFPRIVFVRFWKFYMLLIL